MGIMLVIYKIWCNQQYSQMINSYNFQSNLWQKPYFAESQERQCWRASGKASSVASNKERGLIKGSTRIRKKIGKKKKQVPFLSCLSLKFAHELKEICDCMFCQNLMSYLFNDPYILIWLIIIFLDSAKWMNGHASSNLICIYSAILAFSGWGRQ